MATRSQQVTDVQPRAANPGHDARRWVKLSVDESLFEHLHIAAAKSGLRITPFLRKHLANAQPFAKQ